MKTATRYLFSIGAVIFGGLLLTKGDIISAVVGAVCAIAGLAGILGAKDTPYEKFVSLVKSELTLVGVSLSKVTFTSEQEDNNLTLTVCLEEGETTKVEMSAMRQRPRGYSTLDIMKYAAQSAYGVTPDANGWNIVPNANRSITYSITIPFWASL